MGTISVFLTVIKLCSYINLLQVNYKHKQGDHDSERIVDKDLFF